MQRVADDEHKGEAIPPTRGIRTYGGFFSARTWSALENPNYRLFFAGQTISQTGSWLQRIAQAWLVLDLTDSPAALGVLTAMQFGPILLLSLLAGVLVDRLPKRPFLLIISLVSMAQAVVLTALTLLGHIQLWQVYLLAAVLGVSSAFEMPTRQTFVSELVGRERLPSAINLNSSVFNAARIMGPGLGGVIIARWGVGWCFMLNAISYAAVLLTVLMIRGDQLYEGRRLARGGNMIAQLRDGVAYAWRTPSLAFPLGVLAIVGTLGYNFGVVLPLLARYALNAGSEEFGAMNAAMGLGSVVGALVVTSRVEPGPRAVVIFAVAFGLLLLAVALSPSLWIALAFLVGLGVVSVAYSSLTNTLLQLEAAEEYRGRILSLYTLLFAGSTPIGGAITGVLASIWNVRIAVATEALACAAGALGAWMLYQRHARASVKIRQVK